MSKAGLRRKPKVSASPPIVTLLTDFGLSDYYVAAMKAVLIRYSPSVRLVDITHHVPRHDILCGSITLERAIEGFPPGTIHLAVVDPGVGTARRLLVAEIHQQTVVCPDNGLITWAWRRLAPGIAHELTWRPDNASHTFHGRDILAPVAGRLAAGESLKHFARPIIDPILLPIEPSNSLANKGRIIHVDHFGNATTNVPQDVLRSIGRKIIRAGGVKIGRLKRTYWDVPPGHSLALVGSSGLLEIAVRDGSAALELPLKVGDVVSIE